MMNDFEAISPGKAEAILRAKSSEDDHILVASHIENLADRLTPACKGIIVKFAGWTDHDTLKIRSMGIPFARCISEASFANVFELVESKAFMEISPSVGQVMINGRLWSISSLAWPSPHSGEEFRANVNTLSDIEVSCRLQMSGIGMWRTENWLRSQLAQQPSDVGKSNEGWTEVHPSMIREKFTVDVAQAIKVLNGKPLTIRLFDEEISLPLLGLEGSLTPDSSLGVRACRAGIIKQEWTISFIDAICDSIKVVDNVADEQIWISLPMVAHISELEWYQELIYTAIDRHQIDRKLFVLGINIETPRACLTASTLASKVGFFSFGTNDLTQYIWAWSRRAVGHYLLNKYSSNQILTDDPFKVFDFAGVGEMMRICVEQGQRANPQLILGVSGEFATQDLFRSWAASLGVSYFSVPPSTYRNISLKEDHSLC